ncbi:MAG: hypothetical protein M1434_12185 [Chloroflexi bacterium]|nr:hypothetical protein [Chloroflexota bacterium]MCL5275481.1 hypothetical protein [Chloroflexota bacterium]
MRKIFLVVGAILGVIVAVGVYMFIQFSRPTTVDVPVAVGQIPAGTVLKPVFFRIVHMSNVDNQTLSQWVTAANWAKEADGKATTSDIKAGFPVARSQVDPNSSAAAEMRLSNAITGTNDYYIVVPVKADEVGAYIQPYDRIDLIVSIGSASTNALTLPPTTTDTAGNVVDTTSGGITQTIPPPISKLIMQNMLIIRIDRAAPASSSSANQTDPANATGEVQRLYLKVDRDQLEVLSFVLNNGRRNIAVRAATGSQEAPPTDGVTWDDFVRWFYAQRGDNAKGAAPFDAISPSKSK